MPCGALPQTGSGGGGFADGLSERKDQRLGGLTGSKVHHQQLFPVRRWRGECAAFHAVGVELDVAPVEVARLPRPRCLILKQDAILFIEDDRATTQAELRERPSRSTRQIVLIAGFDMSIGLRSVMMSPLPSGNQLRGPVSRGSPNGLAAPVARSTRQI